MSALMQAQTEVAPFAVEAVRACFPGLAQRVHNKPLVYLDNAATTQKPQVVIDAMVRAYTHQCANIHRGVHLLSAQATEAFEGVREDARAFLRAPSAQEIVFTRGTTEAINLVANSFGHANVHAGDEVLITGLEHHSNIVPWQMLCQARGAHLRVAPIDDTGAVDLQAFAELLSDKTRMVAISHISNALGTVVPVKEMVALAHAKGAVVLVDGAQAVPHGPVDVQDLGCDFYAFSGHKIYGPSGVGVLWGKKALLDAMPPYQGGGDMISHVTFAKSTWAEVPHKFEAGTPDIAGIIALGATFAYLRSIDWAAAQAHEAALLAYGTRALDAIPGVRRIGTAAKRVGVLSFVMDCAHPHDIGTILDMRGIAIRTGHHCAQPVMQRFGVPATARASLGIYNTFADIDALVESIAAVQKMFAPAKGQSAC